MTSTTASIRTGSMTATFATRPGIGQYPAREPVRLVSSALNRTPSVAAQLLKPSDPRCPFPLAEEIVKALVDGGRSDVADKLCLRLDAIRAGAHPDIVSTAEHCVAVLEASEADAAEDATLAAHAVEMGPASWDTEERRLVKEITAKLRLLISGRMLYREHLV